MLPSNQVMHIEFQKAQKQNIKLLDPTVMADLHIYKAQAEA